MIALTIGGCANLRPYKMDIHQGNLIDPNTIDELKMGMSQSEVQSILGTSQVSDSLNSDRLDYIYYEKLAYKTKQIRHVILYFKADQLVDIKYQP